MQSAPTYASVSMSVHVCQKLFCSGAYAGMIGANQILAIVSESLCCCVFVVPASAAHIKAQ